MAVGEAAEILGVSNPQRVTAEEIMQRYNTLYKINAPTNEFRGSPFLQRKIGIARDILEAHVSKQGQGAKPNGGGKSEL